ncbi:helix-turn-helix domain-containing protein [Paenibacillus tianjinensis]|uniref:Helix-turn-helix transcriptional regulator n=1 Tax=Paenibacillus tianjinensis TaxID=2810347 RepID=A0ABX7L602_9BACL|nr:helix-turn-helix transcriptional regulator [Paenibacillus tianjinensis]QSF42646.1 helix-turn-helix transcriptional regulator [Paenibacillus tianjinensis]
MILIKLDDLLKLKNISQREIARRTGIRHPTISEMCLNKSKSLPVENLDKICSELDCELSDIIEYKKEPLD